jgi:peptidoglycan/LPS O-acetylase OafA/YrhL
MKEIKPLTSMRGLFALWVFAFHIEVYSGMTHQLAFLSYGYLGVDFFFLLSGFILAGAHGATFAQGCAAADYLKFMRRRAWRIVPLHWAILAAIVGARLWSDGTVGPGALWQEFAMMNSWFPGSTEINGPDWSLSTEWAANIAFPLLAFMTLDGSKSGLTRTWIVIAAAICGLILCVVGHRGRLDHTETGFALIRCFAEFSLGMALYRFRDAAPVLKQDRTLLGLAVAALILIGLRFNDLATVTLMAAGLVGIAGNRGRVGQVLSMPVFHWLGQVSFSIYLVHLPILLLATQLVADKSPWGVVRTTAITVPTVLIVSALTYRFIESRFKGGIRSMRPKLAPL